MAGFDPLGGERGELRIEVLAQSAYPRIPENRRHTATVSLPSDIEDLSLDPRMRWCGCMGTGLSG
jgi:hypothetical protein